MKGSRRAITSGVASACRRRPALDRHGGDVVARRGECDTCHRAPVQRAMDGRRHHPARATARRRSSSIRTSRASRASGLERGTIEPDTDRIDAALRRAGAPKLLAVLATHSTFDHAMDVPIVAERTDADIAGSRSTGNIARGLAIPRAAHPHLRERRAAWRTRTSTSWPIASPSSMSVDDSLAGDIDIPLRPPVSALAYRSGRSYSLLVDARRTTRAHRRPPELRARQHARRRRGRRLPQHRWTRGEGRTLRRRILARDRHDDGRESRRAHAVGRSPHARSSSACVRRRRPTTTRPSSGCRISAQTTTSWCACRRRSSASTSWPSRSPTRRVCNSMRDARASRSSRRARARRTRGTSLSPRANTSPKLARNTLRSRRFAAHRQRELRRKA